MVSDRVFSFNLPSGCVNVGLFSRFNIINEFQTGVQEVMDKVRYNQFGDKLGAIDKQGNFFLWKVHKQ